jgi:hypothetical protein
LLSGGGGKSSTASRTARTAIRQWLEGGVNDGVIISMIGKRRRAD